MADIEPRYLSQEVDYFGFLEAKLHDLQGISTLVYELIQNADDVKDDSGQPGASEIIFDIRDDALVVTNDGVFREQDFDRLRKVASGAKRDEIGTTGAFGIGFISVYQVTDYPEIFSSGRHWVIRPDASQEHRIEERDAETTATLFKLPWAFDAGSEVRRKLRMDAIRPEQLSKFRSEMVEAITLASLFLKQLKVLQVRQNDILIRRVMREPEEDDCLMIQIGSQRLQIWRVFRGNFDAEAARMRAAHPQIEPKRRSQVVLAIPDEGLQAGRLFAVLPSETTIPLPFHINADFYPSSDRKRILFGEDYQAEWNRAAIRAAAKALAAGLENLPDIMGASSLWQLLQSLDECRREANAGRQDEVFGCFWDEASPRLSQLPLVQTMDKQWVKPAEARLLESDAELEAALIFSALGIQVVHPDLRNYFGFLRRREISVPLLSVYDVVRALENNGVSAGQSLSRAPEMLRSLAAWHIVWQALDAMLRRQQQTPSDRESARKTVQDSPVALDENGHLYPPSQLFQGDHETRRLFKDARWLRREIETDGLLADLVPQFSPRAAITYLRGLGEDRLQADWHKGSLDLPALYHWFEAQKTQLLADVDLLEELRALPVWPAAAQLRPLTELYIPGGFEDPFKISGLVDIEALGGRREFLKDLGVQELTFSLYVKDLLPKTLRERQDLSVAQRRQIVQLLGERLGEIRDDHVALEAMRPLPLVECTDGQFRAAMQVYLPDGIVGILDRDAIFVAATPEEHQEAIFALYRWLGIAQEPRPRDLLAHIRKRCATPPTAEPFSQIEAVFEYLVNNWADWDSERQWEFSLLKDLAWLPGTQQQDELRWYKPQELYATFQRYLFDTQANFLALPRQLQDKAATAKLIGFLGINETPEPRLVVLHLLACSRDNKEVNREVYRFLNQKGNVEAPVLEVLIGSACLFLPDGNYVQPDKVFWGSHPFGRYRYQLGREFRQYDALLQRLGVRESPDIHDYIQVLLDISEEYGEVHKPLDEETHSVILNCWETLSRAYEEGTFHPVDIAVLRDKPLIPDERKILIQSDRIFFEDRAGLKEKLGLGYEAIKRPQNAWRVMEAVGVKLLGQAVNIELIEPLDALPDDEVTARFAERRGLIDRVIESDRAAGVEGLDTTVLTDIQFEKTLELVVRYVLDMWYCRYESPPESIPAQLFSDRNIVVIQHDNGRIPWPAVAREIAYAIKPLGEIGGLAGGIKEALGHDSFDEASRVLDELGYPLFESPLPVPLPASTPLSDFGGPAQPSGDESYVFPPAAGTSSMDTGDSISSPPDSVADDTGVGQPVGPGVSPPAHGPEAISTLPDVFPPTRPEKPRRSSHIVSYVSADEVDQPLSQEDPDLQKRRTQVEKAGVKLVMEYERNHSREPEEMPHLNPGYDVRSVDAQGDLRYIEVKALSGKWEGPNPAQMTRYEFQEAQERGDEYWLYVVEFATSEEAKIYPIPNPIKWVQRYLFDHGWRSLAVDG